MSHGWNGELPTRTILMNTPTRDEARKKSWYALEDPLGTLRDNPRTLHDIGFDAGARWAIMAGSELSPYVSRFIEMLILVGIAPQYDEVDIPTEYETSGIK